MQITLKQLGALQLPLQLRIDALEEQVIALKWLQRELEQQLQQQQSQDGSARHSTAL